MQTLEREPPTISHRFSRLATCIVGHCHSAMYRVEREIHFEDKYSTSQSERKRERLKKKKGRMNEM